MKENAIKKEMKMKQCSDLSLRNEPKIRKEAHDFLERAVDFSIMDAECHFYIGMACYTLGCYEAAIAAFKMALSIDPNHALALEAMMEACDSIDFYNEEVIETCAEIISHNPKHTAAHAFLGKCYHEVGLRDKAIPVLKQAIAIDPKVPLPHLILGKIYAELGDRRSAMEQYKELGRSDKSLAESLLHFIDSRSYLKSNSTWITL
jgi:tetratricopeptide (TPR) repeat protein